MIAKLESMPKQTPNTEPQQKWEVHKTINQQQQSHHLKTDSSLSLWGLKCILLEPNLHPRFCCKNTNCIVKSGSSTVYIEGSQVITPNGIVFKLFQCKPWLISSESSLFVKVPIYQYPVDKGNDQCLLTYDGTCTPVDRQR